jgi:hypothetical protein
LNIHHIAFFWKSSQSEELAANEDSCHYMHKFDKTSNETMIATRFASNFQNIAKASARTFSNSTTSNAKVAILGAAGGIGQPLSMLCKLSNHIDELSCYDIVGTPGVAADLSHVSERINP